jgi:putative peptidoglycan lipid II flippase
VPIDPSRTSPTLDPSQPLLPAGVDRVAADSLIGAVWTLVSRASGLIRVVVVAAVLGPTQFGNLYQAANTLPNLTFELLTGALFASLVVPALVRHLDGQDLRAASRIASGFLSLALAAAAAVVLVGVLGGPLLLAVLSAGVPAGSEAAELGPAWLLLALLLVQVPLYVLAGMGAAVQNARGRFAVAAAAPSVENVGIIVTLGAYAATFGTGVDGQVGMAQVVLLGGGTTAAVAAHAAVQWLAARRLGVALRLSNGWSDTEVRAIARLAVPSLGYSGLNVARFFCMLVVAAAVPGGVIAVSLALNFYNLPVALGTRPVAQASLPALSRAHGHGDSVQYAQAFDRGLSLAMFVAVPAALGYAALSGPLAGAVAFGEMATTEGRQLIQFALLGISLGLIGEAVLVFATQASYARRNGTWPLRAVALRTVVAVAGMLSCLAWLDGSVLLLGIGASIAVSDVLAGAFLCWAVRRESPRTHPSLWASLSRTGAASLAMLCPVGLLLLVVDERVPDSQAGSFVTVLAAALVGLGSYLLVQRLLRSPQLKELAEALRGRPA